MIILTVHLPKCVRICSGVLCVYLNGLSSTINIPLVVYFVYGSTAIFLFQCPITSLSISKEPRGKGDRSGPRIIDIGQVIRKLWQFPQVQSERERTLVIVYSSRLF